MIQRWKKCSWSPCACHASIELNTELHRGSLQIHDVALSNCCCCCCCSCRCCCCCCDVTAMYPWMKALQPLAEHVPGVQFLVIVATISIYSKVPKVLFCSHPTLVEMLLNLITEQNRLLKLDDLKCYTEHSLRCLCSQHQQHYHQQQQSLQCLALLSEQIPHPE